jgi:hypothetical protein
MKKLLLFGLVLALIGAAVLPAVTTPKPAEAGLFDATITCNPGELDFTHYTGVPETLLGFIPLETQAVTVTSNKFWSASDDADWLTLLATVFPGEGKLTVWLNNNVDNLEAGTHTATITVKASGLFASSSATIDVTLEVIEPAVMGPLGIGVDKGLLKGITGGEILGEENEYSGFVVNLLTNPDDTMDMQAIETDGCWDLNLQIGDEIPGQGLALTGGALTINGETIQIMGGGVGEISMLMSMMGGALPIPSDFDWGENYVAMFVGSDGKQYVGIVLGDLGKLLDLLPMLGDMFTGEEAESTALPAPTGKDSKKGNPNGPAPNEPSPELVIPLKPILNLLPSLMPVMTNLLGNETVISLLTPLMEALPPIMIILPIDVMMGLLAGLM